MNISEYFPEEIQTCPTPGRKGGVQTPPNTPEGEIGYLGCLMLQNDPRALRVLIDDPTSPREGDFYDLRHATIYETIRLLADKNTPVDLITVQQRLRDIGKLEACGGPEYLLKIADSSPSPANAPYYAEMILEKAKLRAILKACGEATEAVFSGAQIDEVTSKAERAIIEACAQKRRQKPPQMRDLVIEAIDEIERRHEGRTTGVMTGFPDLDKHIGAGMEPGDFVCIAGRPSAGKTSFAMNIATRTADGLLAKWKAENGDKPYSGPKVLVFSLEMTPVQLVQRMIQCESGVSIHKAGSLSAHDFVRLTDAAAHVASLPIVIDGDSSLTISGLSSIARSHHANGGVGMIIVDYIQLMQTERRRSNENREQEVASISRGLKALAKELNIPVVGLAQLNRESEKAERAPMMSDLRESGQIEADASFIWILYSMSKGEEGSPKPIRRIELRVAKARNGPRGFDVPLTFFGTIFRFESAAPATVSSSEIEDPL